MLAARATAAAGVATWAREATARRLPQARRRSALRQGHGVARLAVLFGTVGLLLMLYVAEQAWIISLTYRLNETRAALHAATVETDRLQLRISELSAPGRIERIAREKLHLVASVPPAYLDGTVKVALAKPVEEGRTKGLPVIARLQRLLRGAPVQAAPAAD